MRANKNSAAWLCLTLAACAPTQYRISSSPSLRPVDAARPMVVFSQIQGRACGNDAVLGAIRDMKRLDPVDGYIEVVIEESGEAAKRCAKVTAYPFRYGNSPETPTVRVADQGLEPEILAGRDCKACADAAVGGPEPAADGCARDCERIAPLVESGTIKQALARDRCLQRCARPDPRFAACIAAAQERVAASACTAAPAATTERQP
jgi:hypothetical protein